MARPLRSDRPNTTYHVLSRGNQRGPNFDDMSACDRFAELLGTVSKRYGIEMWAYVLMGSHRLVGRSGPSRLYYPESPTR